MKAIKVSNFTDVNLEISVEPNTPCPCCGLTGTLHSIQSPKVMMTYDNEGINLLPSPPSFVNYGTDKLENASVDRITYAWHLCTNCNEVILFYSVSDERTCSNCNWHCKNRSNSDRSRYSNTLCELAPYVKYEQQCGYCKYINKPKRDIDSNMKCAFCKYCKILQPTDIINKTFADRDQFYLKKGSKYPIYDIPVEFGCTMFKTKVTDVPEVCQLFECSEEKINEYTELCKANGLLFPSITVDKKEK